MSVVDYQEAINNLLIFNVCIWYLLRHEKNLKAKILTVMSGPAQMSNWFLINSFVSAIMGHIYFLLPSLTFRRWKKVKPNLSKIG